MGNCFGQPYVRRRHRRSTFELQGRLALGKTVPLRHEVIKWKSSLPLTRDQITSKRAEFWHTAPAFEGRQEIWDALRVASEALEKGDHELAQAIVDGANIIVPHGILTECYDELGNRYQLPLYVLSFPINVIDSLTSGCGDLVAGLFPSTSGTNNVSMWPGTVTMKEDILMDKTKLVSADGELDALDGDKDMNYLSLTTPVIHHSPKVLCTATILKKPTEGLRGLLQLSEGIGELLQKQGLLSSNTDESKNLSHLVQLPCRLSTGHEILMLCSPDDKVSELKHRLAATMKTIPSLSSQMPSFDNQRWFCAGRPLLETWRLTDCHVPTGWVVQVIIHAPKWMPPPPSPVENDTLSPVHSSEVISVQVEVTTAIQMREEIESSIPYCDDTTVED